MEIGGSLPHSQKPSTGLYPKSDQHSPCLPYNILKINLNTIFLSKPRSFKWPVCVTVPHQNPVCTSSVPHACFPLILLVMAMYSQTQKFHNGPTRKPITGHEIIVGHIIKSFGDMTS